MRSTKMLGFIVVLVLIVGTVVIVLQKSRVSTPTTSTSPTQDTSKDAATAQTHTPGNVRMKTMQFTPSQISVAKGATVTWTNDDSISHTVADDLGKGPSSSNIAPGATYSYTFTATGSYQYHCSIHSSMRGTIVVK